MFQNRIEMRRFESVYVYDNVMTEEVCTLFSDCLYNITMKYDDGLRGMQSQSLPFRVFDRMDSNQRKGTSLNMIESAIEKILQNMGDESRFVEYWWRGYWCSHVLHRDIDEMLFQEQALVRFPRHGHVLYLHNDPHLTEQGGGQTVVLEDFSSTANGRKLYVVPPRQGRLLRFRGDLLHGVPRPAFEYFLRDQGVEDVRSALKHLPVHDSDYHEPADFNCDPSAHSLTKRSVVLFNTWDDCAPVPVTLSEARENDLGVEHNSTIALPCQFVNWKKVPFLLPLEDVPDGNDDFAPLDKTDFMTVRFMLPSDRSRRDSYKKTLALESRAQAGLKAFLVRRDDMAPSAILLHGEEDTDE